MAAITRCPAVCPDSIRSSRNTRSIHSIHSSNFSNLIRSSRSSIRNIPSIRSSHTDTRTVRLQIRSNMLRRQGSSSLTQRHVRENLQALPQCLSSSRSSSKTSPQRVNDPGGWDNRFCFAYGYSLRSFCPRQLDYFHLSGKDIGVFYRIKLILGDIP